MIEKQLIASLVESSFEDENLFLVEIKMTIDNKVFVYIDSFEGVSIDVCAKISKTVASKLEEEDIDFELQVSSAGIGNPFKVKKQYLKCLGKQVSLVLKDGEKLQGTLSDVQENEIRIEIEKKVRTEGKKKKITQIEMETVQFEQIVKATEIITF